MCLASRLRAARRLAAVMSLISAAALWRSWFAAQYRSVSPTGALARRLAALLVLWSTPDRAPGAVTLGPRELTGIAHGLVALGLLLVSIEVAVAVAPTTSSDSRRSPSWTSSQPGSSRRSPPLRRSRCARRRRPPAAPLAIVTILAAATVLPGSRGPVLGLVVGAVTMALVRRSLLDVPALAASPSVLPGGRPRRPTSAHSATSRRAEGEASRRSRRSRFDGSGSRTRSATRQTGRSSATASACSRTTRRKRA